MILIAKSIVFLFGMFLIATGIVMLLKPKYARATLRKAGSTNFINYTEITVRIIPATAMVIYAEFSRFPEFFKFLGWFMIITSLILYIVPRKLHHGYSMKAADILKPLYFQFISPFSFLFGGFMIYCIL